MTDTAFSHQAGFAMLIVYAIQFLKNAGWFPWLTQNTDMANRIVSLVTAVFVAVGIQWSMSGTWQAGGTITLTFPPAQVMFDAFLHYVTQVGLQETFYKTAIK